MEKRKARIVKNDERCAGCALCVLSCSLVHFGVFSPIKSYIRLEKDDRKARFSLSIGEGCKSCGECARACAYGALRWEHENSCR